MYLLLSFVITTFSLSVNYELFVNEQAFGNLTETQIIPYPEKIEVRSENSVNVEINIIAKGRKVYSLSTKTNQEEPLRPFKGVNKIHITVYDDPQKPFTHYLDIQK